MSEHTLGHRRFTMQVRRGVGWALLLATSLAPSVAGASGLRQAANASSSDIAVGVSVPGGRLPRGAVVRVTLTVRNVSSHVVALPRIATPNVVVTTVRGRRVYDSRSPFAGQMVRPVGGKRLPDTLLGPGAVKRVRRFVLLRGAVVRGYAVVRAGADLQRVRGPRVRVRLGSGDAPAVAVRAEPVPSASVSGSVSPAAPLFYTDEVTCGDATVTMVTYQLWSALSGTTVRPQLPQGCPGPWHWLAIVGALNHTAATIDLRQPPQG